MFPKVYNSKELSENYRGRELLSFSNYKMFEKILQDHVVKLKDPAMDLLNGIKGIPLHIFVFKDFLVIVESLHYKTKRLDHQLND